MKMKRILAFSSLVLVGVVGMSFVVLGSSAQFVDDSESEFNSGAYNDTQFDAGNSWVELDATGLTNGSGDFTSQIFDSTADSSWDTIAWVPERPTGKPLPESDGIETVYNDGNIDMTGNVLLYHLDETSGSVADTSGSGITGTVDGATLGAAGIIGNAIDVTGNGDQVENDAMSLTLGAEVTLMAWFKYSGPGTGSPRILEFSRLGDANSTALAPDADGSLRAWAECNNGARVGSVDDPTPTYDDGEWHHMAYTYDGSIGRLYVDGTQTDTTAGVCANLDDPTVLTLGAISDVSGQFSQTQHEFDGYIDEAAIMNTALSATEINDIYKRGALDLQFQVRSCDDPSCTGESFIGPDGTAGTYYEWTTTTDISTPSFTLTNVPDNRYFQYQVSFSSEDNTLSPELKSVSVDFTILNANPDTPTNVTPAAAAINQGTNPDLSASVYNDDDLDPHDDTEWQVDDNSDFSSPVWTRTAGSAEESTTIDDTNGTFANELSGLDELLGGATYYWRVRYQDDVGNWSAYSTPTTFTTKLSSGGGGGSTAIEQFPPSNPHILINGGDDCTASEQVSLSLTASNAVTVHVSNDPTFADDETLLFSDGLTLDWQLLPGEGTKTVYAVYQTSAGVTSLIVSDFIELSSDCTEEPPTEEELEEILIELPLTPLPAPLPTTRATCEVGCEENEYVLYIINPDGTRRDSNGDFAKIRLRADTLDIQFEDSGSDMDFNDIVFSLTTQTCPEITVELTELNAGWDHQVGLEVIRDGLIFSDEIIFTSTQNAFTTTRVANINLNDTDFSCVNETPRTFAHQYIEVFSLPNFEGTSEIFEVGSDPDLRDNAIGNDNIASVKLFGGVLVEFFSDTFFSGFIERMFQDENDLRDNAIGGDRISSINVVPLVVDPNAPARDIRIGDRVEEIAEVSPPITSSCASIADFTTELRIGFFGEEVRQLQALLQCLGHFPEHISPTAYYGPITSQAVSDFQLEQSLPATGITDTATREALNRF